MGSPADGQSVHHRWSGPRHPLEIVARVPVGQRVARTAGELFEGYLFARGEGAETDTFVVAEHLFVAKLRELSSGRDRPAREQIDLANLAIADAVHVLEPLTVLEEDEGDHAAR
jgi:hypothetical protein